MPTAEKDLTRRLAQVVHGRSAARSGDVDVRSRDGRVIIEAKVSSQGARDLRSAVMSLALAAERDHAVERAVLVISVPKMSRARVEKEWAGAESILRPDVARRMAVVAFTSDGALIAPDEGLVRRIADAASDSLRPPEITERPQRARSPTRKTFCVLSVLVDAWLQGEPAIRIGELMTRAGASYPSVAAALERMQQRQEIERTTSRGVRLRVFPSASFKEALSLSESLRNPVAYVDGTGRTPDPDGLLRRISRLRPPDVGIGGVAAGRHWDAELDLVGLPRLDVTAPRGPRRWLHELDPGLRAAGAGDRAKVLVVHEPLAALSEAPPDTPIYLGPTETLLDLHELGLAAQAAQLVDALRGRHD